jgi:hypothetical protein
MEMKPVKVANSSRVFHGIRLEISHMILTPQNCLRMGCAAEDWETHSFQKPGWEGGQGSAQGKCLKVKGSCSRRANEQSQGELQNVAEFILSHKNT